MMFRILTTALCLHLASGALAPWPSDMELRPNEGEVVYATGSFQVLEVDPVTFEPPKIAVKSDIPVIASRLTAGSSAFLESPIPYNEALVVVKSSGCPEGTDIQVNMDNSTEGSTYTLQITTNTDPGTEFLESSALFRQLGCMSQVDPPCNTPAPEATTPPDTNGGTSTVEGATTSPVSNGLASQATRSPSVLLSLVVVGISALMTGRSRGTMLFLLSMGAFVLFTTTATSSSSSSPVFVSATRELQQCTVNVEVIYWGCGTVMEVTAPALKLRNMLQTTTQDRDACNCTSLATFLDTDGPREEPYQYLDYDADNNITGTDPMVVAEAASSNCLVAMGRPFRDEQGVSIVSKTEFHDDKDNEWSHHDLELWKQYNSIPPKPSEIDSPSLAQEWATRALGEHASVASFSAFTIALMSNGAPPHLIQESLVAAQDELRHAQVSFQVASFLMRGTVEPSVLPSSSHYFGSDILTLAKGVIEEGCIDETLSALKMAADVDAKSTAEDEWMWNITRKIALEEGNHSILAWKTVQWICSTDATICSNLQNDMLKKERLLAAGVGKHDVASIVYQAWACLAGPMACHATKGTGCATAVEECAGLSDSSLVQQLVLQITEGVKKPSSAEMM